jgi:hypothetical protein
VHPACTNVRLTAGPGGIPRVLTARFRAKDSESRLCSSEPLACQIETVVRGGVEPPTFRFSGGRSYQLSYLTATGACVLVDNGARSSGPDGI